MLKVVEDYFTAKRKANEDYESKRTEAFHELYYSDRDKYNELGEQYIRAFKEATEAATDLLRDSDDKIVEYIAKYALKDYPDNAEAVLRMLPCSIDTLNAYAKDSNWCDTWTDMVEDAIEAGVVEGDKVAKEVRAFKRALRDNVGLSKNQQKELVKHMNVFLKASVGDDAPQITL